MNAWTRRSAARLRALRARWRFKPTRLVWSRGLALLCDHDGGTRFVREQRGGAPPLRFDPDAYDNVRDGDLVWVRLIALPQFAQQALPRIRARFALVTGDEDWSIPSDFPGARQLLDDDRIVCWFSQNADGADASGKVLPIPIGIDFHTIANGPTWGSRQASPLAQEAQLERLRSRMAPSAERLTRVHADFHFTLHQSVAGEETRADVERVLRGNPEVDFLSHSLPRLGLWREKLRYAFVVSPRGNGLDCHRTWESLALGAIVIVKHSPLDRLYEGLPVVTIDHWDEITPDNLRLWRAQLGPMFADPQVQARLTNRHWIEWMRRTLMERLGAPA